MTSITVAVEWGLFTLSLNSERHDHSNAQIASRTCFPHSLLHEPSRYPPVANGKPTFCLLNYEFRIPSACPFPTGFKVVPRHHSRSRDLEGSICECTIHSSTWTISLSVYSLS